ncbi:MAG: helix-turn-helix domain-containing protein [Synergistaceae bacterium]|jgi:hypothetical protein|nr:helix-turn-helix domain-containing protein [Synergistaceae bacterium]
MQVITTDALELMVQFNATIKILIEEIKNLQALVAEMKAATSRKKALFSPKEAAVYLNVSEATLARGRSEGVIGDRTPTPEYIKIGDSVKYPEEDLIRWYKEEAPRFGGRGGIFAREDTA